MEWFGVGAGLTWGWRGVGVECDGVQQCDGVRCGEVGCNGISWNGVGLGGASSDEVAWGVGWGGNVIITWAGGGYVGLGWSE